MTPRVVLDTNVVVSAVLDEAELGPPFLCLRAGLEGARRVQLIVSQELLTEYRDILHRPKFPLSPERVEQLLSDIERTAAMVTPADLPTESVSDPKDWHVLATAVAGKADYLVTGNIKHFPPRYEGIEVLLPAAFVETVKPWI